MRIIVVRSDSIMKSGFALKITARFDQVRFGTEVGTRERERGYSIDTA